MFRFDGKRENKYKRMKRIENEAREQSLGYGNNGKGKIENINLYESVYTRREGENNYRWMVKIENRPLGEKIVLRKERNMARKCFGLTREKKKSIDEWKQKKIRFVQKSLGYGNNEKSKENKHKRMKIENKALEEKFGMREYWKMPRKFQ